MKFSGNQQLMYHPEPREKGDRVLGLQKEEEKYLHRLGYAFATIHAHRALYKERGLLIASEKKY